MQEGESQGAKIFLKYWLLIAVLGGFNVYNYVRNGNWLSFWVAVVCGVAFIGWILFYVLYVRAKR